MLEQAYYLSGVIAAVGVIASLLFLAIQVRNNTKTVRNQHFESHQDRLASTFSRPLDRQVAKIIEKGQADFETLDGDEKIVFGAWAVEYLSNVYGIMQMGQSVLRPEIAEMVDRRLKWFFRVKGADQWFRDAARHPMPRPVEQRINSVLSEHEPCAV